MEKKSNEWYKQQVLEFFPDATNENNTIYATDGKRKRMIATDRNEKQVWIKAFLVAQYRIKNNIY